jgi:toxin ParE1/3/4
VKKQIVLRQSVVSDVDAAVGHYLQTGGASLASDFVNRLQQAYSRIEETPSAGSPRFGLATGLEGLRSHRLKQFPYLVFYAERGDRLEIWRVLHDRRDIGASLREPDEA